MLLVWEIFKTIMAFSDWKTNWFLCYPKSIKKTGPNIEAGFEKKSFN